MEKGEIGFGNTAVDEGDICIGCSKVKEDEAWLPSLYKFAVEQKPAFLETH